MTRKMKLFCIVFITLTLSANGKGQVIFQNKLAGKGGCRTPKGESGFCVRLHQCHSLYSKLNDGDRPQDFVDYLQRSHCSFENFTPIVCCPDIANGHHTTIASGTRNTVTTTRMPTTRRRTTRKEYVTKMPVTKRPVTRIPVTRRPVTKRPVTRIPVTIRPVTKRPGTTRPVTKRPGTIRPVTQKTEAIKFVNSIPAAHPPMPKSCGQSIYALTRIIGGREAPKASCGKRKISSDSTISGVPAKKGAWPWIAALGYSGFRGRLDFLCGGALITERHILTAAHCVINREDLSVVRLGSLNLENDMIGSYEEIKISQKIPHEGYDPKKSDENDIAILNLEKPVEFKDTIRPICLPTGSFFRDNQLTSLNGAVSGWGAIDYEGPRTAVLMEARIPIKTNEECKQSYSIFNKVVVDDRTICAGNGLSDACQGDSGGPLMVYDRNTKSYNVAGVISIGYKCAEKGYPGIYTRVTSFLDWINEKTI